MTLKKKSNWFACKFLAGSVLLVALVWAIIVGINNIAGSAGLLTLLGGIGLFFIWFMCYTIHSVHTDEFGNYIR